MKRLLLISLGLMSVGLYVGGCLPENTTTTGTAGTTGGGSAGTNGAGTAGTFGGDAGTNGGDAGTNGNMAGTNGNMAGTNGNMAGTNGNMAGTSGGGTSGGGTSGGGTTGRGGTTGTGGGGTTGQGGRGGAAGTTALGGRGGTTGTAGTSAAGTSGGTAGTTGTGGATGNAVCDSVKQLLDGFEYLLPCGVNQSYSVLVCQNNSPNCVTGANGEYMTMGTCNTDKVLTVAGPTTQSCTVTLHVQGVVEPKHYQTGTNRCATSFGTSTEGLAFGPAAGGTSSGCYPSTSGNYNVYMMHVSDSATVSGSSGLTGTRYFWNAINKNEAHFSYKIDYTTPAITIKGGQKLWMLANDSNRSAIKNCADTSIDGTAIPPARCDALTVANVVPAPGPAITQPYNGQFVLLHVVTAQ